MQLLRQYDIRELFLERCRILLTQMMNYYENEHDDDIIIHPSEEKNVTQLIEIIIKWGIENNIHRVQLHNPTEERFDNTMNLETTRRSTREEMKAIIILFHKMMKIPYFERIINQYMDYIYTTIIELDCEIDIREYQIYYDPEESMKSLIFLFNRNKSDEWLKRKLRSEILKLIIHHYGLIILIKMFSVGRMREMPGKMSEFITNQLINKDELVVYVDFIRNTYQSIMKMLKKTEEKVMFYYLLFPFMKLEEIVSNLSIPKQKELYKSIKELNQSTFTKKDSLLIRKSTHFTYQKDKNDSNETNQMKERKQDEEDGIVEIKIKEEQIENIIRESIGIQKVCEDLHEDKYIEYIEMNSKFNEIKQEKEGLVLIELLINIIVLNKESIKMNQNISSIINSIIQLTIPHFFPYICIIFNYLFEYIPSCIYNPVLIEHFIELLKVIDYSNYEEDIKSFLHSTRNLIELLNDENISSIFTLQQMKYLSSIMKSIQTQIHYEDKEGYDYINNCLDDFIYLLTNLHNSKFLF